MGEEEVTQQSATAAAQHVQVAFGDAIPARTWLHDLRAHQRQTEQNGQRLSHGGHVIGGSATQAFILAIENTFGLLASSIFLMYFRVFLEILQADLQHSWTSRPRA